MFAVKLANTSASDMVAGISGLFSHNPLMVAQRKLATNALSQLPPKETLIWVKLQRQRKTGHVVGDEGWGGGMLSQIPDSFSWTRDYKQLATPRL